jgi:hypothetical protein
VLGQNGLMRTGTNLVVVGPNTTQGTVGTWNFSGIQIHTSLQKLDSDLDSRHPNSTCKKASGSPVEVDTNVHISSDIFHEDTLLDSHE